MSKEASDQATPDASEGGAILSALEGDLDAAKCRTVDACLRHVFAGSKQLPSTVVQSLLVNLDPDEVRQVHEKMMQNYLDDQDASLSLFKRIAATVWFVQLLLHCISLNESPLSKQEANTMAVSLLQNLSKTIKNILHSEDNIGTPCNNNEAETININVTHAPSVAEFTIRALLRAIDPYVSSLPALMFPLWKGICDLVASSTKFSCPLAEWTLKALSTYLLQGQSQTMKSLEQYIQTRQVAQQQAFPFKVLVFLVARASVLMRIYVTSQAKEDSNSTSDTLANTAIILLQLRGMTLATKALLKAKYSSLTEQDEAFLQPFQLLETKAEQCLVNSWLQQSGASESILILERRELNTLLRLQHEPTSTQKKTLIASSFAIGKSLTLHHLLERTVTDFSCLTETLREGNVQSLLCICQELLFSTLPLCTTIGKEWSALTLQCLTTMASVMVLCHAKGAMEKRPRLNVLLIRWLATPSSADSHLHPWTRELLLSLIPLYALGLYQAYDSANRSNSPRSVDLNDTSNNAGQDCVAVQSFITLLVKVLLDPRTQTSHKRNLASVVIRLMGEESSESTLVKIIDTMVQQTIAVELRQLIRYDIKVERRKQKKIKSSQDDSVVCPLGSFDVEDVRVLIKVLQRVSTFDLPSLDRELACMVRDVSSIDLTSKKQRYAIGNYSQNAMALLLALLSGTTRGGDARTARDSFKRKTGMEKVAFASSLVKWLTQQQARGSKSKPNRVRKAHSVVIVPSLHFICTSFECAGMSVNDIRAIVGFIKECTVASCQVLQTDPPLRDSDERRSAASVLFAAASFLAGTTKVIPMSCSSDILQDIASTFKMLFNTKSWPIVACTMASLVRFASTIPSCHQGILPECISADAQGLLQCRLQGMVYRAADSYAEEDSTTVNDSCNQVLKRLIPTLESQDSLYVAASNNTIVEGSYVLTMPTKDGRSAQVIFAPGEESLEDIKYMLGDVEDIQIRTLQRVQLIGNGEGCRLLSKVL